MKNRYTYRLVPLLIFSTILLWPFFSGCKKESPPLEEKELEPKVELTVTPEGVIPYGGSIDIRWTADQNTNKVVVKVNGVIKATSSGSASRAGALYLGPLFKDLLVSVTATNVDLSTEVEKEVHVGELKDVSDEQASLTTLALVIEYKQGLFRSLKVYSAIVCRMFVLQIIKN